MPGLVNSGGLMMCPHGGIVQAVTGNTRVSVGGAFALRSSDAFTIIGCAFATPGGPHPCIRVQWVQPAARSKVLGEFTLTQASVGLCIAPDEAVQGTVLIVETQSSVSGV
jgi:hypothetical protein